MTATELTNFRQRLQGMTQRLGGERLQLRHEVLGDERAPGVSTTQEQYTSDDLSREEADEEVALSMLNNEEELLTECVAALDRLERGTFGSCESCRRPIAGKRLDAAPYVRRCINCERGSGTKTS